MNNVGAQGATGAQGPIGIQSGPPTPEPIETELTILLSNSYCSFPMIDSAMAELTLIKSRFVAAGNSLRFIEKTTAIQLTKRNIKTLKDTANDLNALAKKLNSLLNEDTMKEVLD